MASIALSVLVKYQLFCFVCSFPCTCVAMVWVLDHMVNLGVICSHGNSNIYERVAGYVPKV